MPGTAETRPSAHYRTFHMLRHRDVFHSLETFDMCANKHKCSLLLELPGLHLRHQGDWEFPPKLSFVHSSFFTLFNHPAYTFII